jgi:adenylate cyclase
MALGRAYRRDVMGETGDGGAEEAERALALNDRLAEAHAAKAWILGAAGRLDEASADIEAALRLDPDSHEVIDAAARTLFRRHRFEEAAQHWERAVQLIDQDTTSLGMLITCYRALQREQDVRRIAEILLGRVEKILAHDRNDSRVLGHGCLALAALGRQDRAREWMSRALLIDPDNVNMRYNFACTLATYLKAGDAALEMLAPAFRTMGSGMLSHAKVDPDLDDIRAHPRFVAMVAEAEARLQETASASAAG